MRKQRSDLINIIGKRFGRLCVADIVKIEGKKHKWKCKCDCGGETITSHSALRRGTSKSCGCLRLESIKKNNTIHGYYKTKAYNSYVQMMDRCFNEKSFSYPDYGGKGITVCERWLDINNFMEDMGERPDGTSIDRIDNNKGYEPSNCRWATAQQQSRNRTNIKKYFYNGKYQTLTELCEEYGKGVLMVYKRLKRGWSLHDALTINSMSNKQS